MNPSPPDTDSELSARLARVLAPAYDLEREIGRGGMAIVYRARDPRLKRGVAVKLLPPDLAFRSDIRSRFLREAETAAHLSHPNIVPIYTVDERDGLVYFVMALVEGESVGDRLKRAGPMPIADARRILREVANALAYAHANGVVHRDIKPDNILLDANSGRSMVTDFGIARAARDGETRLTATGAAIGTPAYMSPEQCSGDREIDGRSDLYSLGAVAYHMITGAPPFTGGNTPSVMMKQVMEAPAPLRERRRDVPEDLEAIVMRLLEKNPSKRFADGAALVAALDGTPLAPLAPLPLGAQELLSTNTGRRRPLLDVNVPLVTITHHLGESPQSATIGLVAKLGKAQDRMEQIEAFRAARRAGRGRNRPLPDRIRSFRQQLVSYTGTSIFLFAINAMTSGHGHVFWWAVFPVLGMGLGVVKSGGKLWADGARLKDVFGPLPPSQPPGNAALSAAAPKAPSDFDQVLAGPHGPVLRQAMADRRTISDLIQRLSNAERQRIPDVQGTADALYDRIGALASALDRLDGEVAPDRLPALDARIAQIEQSSETTADRERRLGLLKRQRDMLAELARSRDALVEQFESAGLLLQNLSLDMLKVRSSGLDSALESVASVTQEARALSREIGYALDAAAELRELERKGDTTP
ncbi:MAG: protein kinase domain-containing protein [Deltaproteobacteria bacterium]